MNISPDRINQEIAGHPNLRDVARRIRLRKRRFRGSEDGRADVIPGADDQE